MLSVYDELPIHQTPATLDHVATSDPNAYERFYFGAFDRAGEKAIGFTLTVHPNRGIVDAAFGVTVGTRYESLMITDELGHDPADLRCGPLRHQLTEPMRRLRFSVADTDGFSVDVEFAATTPAIEEARVTRVRERRIVQDRSRYVQLGTVTGTVHSPLGTFEPTPETWFAGRDHSWGIWDGPKDHVADVKPAPPSFYWLIGEYGDQAVQAVTHADAEQGRYGEYAAVCPTLAGGADLAGPGALQQARPFGELNVEYAEHTRHMTTAQLSIGGSDGTVEFFDLESVCVVHPHTIGYSHPTWRSGTVHADLPHVERYGADLADLDLTESHHHRALQGVRIRCGDDTGFGVIDQFAGPQPV